MYIFVGRAQWHSVMIPDKPCDDCTLRLLRDAKEWKDYGFWSCADISIVKPTDYKEDCLSRGNPNPDGMCACKKGKRIRIHARTRIFSIFYFKLVAVSLHDSLAH